MIPTNLGRVPPDRIQFDARNGRFPLRAALPLVVTKSALENPPTRRLWYLRRDQQVDQGNTPHCVAATAKHWERSWPVGQQSGLDVDGLYSEFKKLDGYPDQDGSDGHAALKYYKGVGMVSNYFWWDGDDEALDLWLLTAGTAAFGAYWTDEMFQTLPDGRITVGMGTMYAGHETLLNGFDRKTGRTYLVNSWGLDNFGIQGRGYLTYEDRRRLLDYYGDAVVMVQQRL